MGATTNNVGLFDLIPFIPVNNLPVTSGWVFLGWTSTKQGLMCLAQGHNTVTPGWLEPAAPRSRVKRSTTEPLRTTNNGLKTAGSPPWTRQKPWRFRLWYIQIQLHWHSRHCESNLMGHSECFSVGHLYEDKSLALRVRDLIFFTTELQSMNYYTTIHS